MCIRDSPQKHVKPKQEEKKEQPKKTLRRKVKEAQKKDAASEMLKRIGTGMKGSKFRWINEQLYTKSSEDSFNLFKEDKGTFADYHEGYSQMVAKWPKNPLDVIIKELKKDEYKGKTIIDLGCGTGRLAEEVKKERKVLSYDFVASNPWVTECDIAHLPLKNEEADVAVFCLSLMGTNYLNFIAEANRCLKHKGKMVIAEVSSRVKDLKEFVKGVCLLGFESIKASKCEDYFVIMMLRKTGDSRKGIKMLKDSEMKNGPLLQPCHYKKR
eukprot:TRINITY_DN8054_c0_g1_i13.p1 TRINITY_DN8054_c0_g1~~TRINITY_DN8054_c0_g1_i13.p1  ORF type:complete len:269 (-),score=64.80 TRINITY_DN8054_c0_g1_i13:105-911(-)